MDAVMVNPRLSLPLRWRRLETQRQPTTGLTPTLDSLAVLCSHNQSGCLPVHRLAPTHKHLLMSEILLKHFQTAALMLCVMLRICVRHNLGFLFGPRSLNIVPQLKHLCLYIAIHCNILPIQCPKSAKVFSVHAPHTQVLAAALDKASAVSVIA